jgi:hypothetical protein
MRPASKKFLVFLAAIFIWACKKDPPAAASIPATPEQTTKLLIGDWIEDSVNFDNILTVHCFQPSYLKVDGNLNYKMVQTADTNNAGNSFNGSDTGQFTDIGTRYFTPASFDRTNDFLGMFGRLQIDTLTEHRLVLFSYQDSTAPPVWYYHR